MALGREQIGAWIVRRTALAVAGSVAVNLAILAIVAGSLAAAGPTERPSRPLMTVTLVAPPPPPAQPVLASVTPPRREAMSVRPRRADRPAEGAPVADPEAEIIPGTNLASSPAIAARPSAPRGLAGLLEDDPCLKLAPRDRPAECRTGWSDKVAAVPRALAKRIERSVDQKLAASTVVPDCGSIHLGCTPIPEKTLIGTRPADRSMQAGGPTGTDSMVGRLPPPNAYHVDPGFGD